MDIAKSVIVITAAGTPTGRAMAEHFCSLNARVALVDTHGSSLQATYESCLVMGGVCYSFKLKDRTVESIGALFEDIIREMGAVDVLINYWQTGALPGLLATADTVNQSMADIASNLYLFGRGAAFSMLDQGRKGVIVNITGMNDDHYESIDSSNAVITGLTKSWALELEPVNIRVGGVIPVLRYRNPAHRERNTAIDYELISSAEYIVKNDTFTGRMLESNA